MVKKNKKKLTIVIVSLILTLGLLQITLNLGPSNLRSLKFEKDDNDLEKYACLFRSKKVKKPQLCDLLHEKYKLHDIIDSASEAFDVPGSVIFCTALTESGFDPHAKSGRNRGYGQFSKVATHQLQNILKKNKRYRDMWQSYTQKPMKAITVKNVMYEENPEIPIGAISLYARWMFDRIDQLNCWGCGPSFLLTDKKIALMIAGYNWSPYKFKKFAHLSLSTLKDEDNSPLPPISRRYIHSMNYCRSSGEFEKLRIGHRVQDKRIKQCSGGICAQGNEI
jgi:hypothetical protein